MDITNLEINVTVNLNEFKLPVCNTQCANCTTASNCSSCNGDRGVGLNAQGPPICSCADGNILRVKN